MHNSIVTLPSRSNDWRAGNVDQIDYMAKKREKEEREEASRQREHRRLYSEEYEDCCEMYDYGLGPRRGAVGLLIDNA